MNAILNRKIIFCTVLVVLFLTTFTAYAKESEFTAVQWLEKGQEYKASKNFDSAIFAYNQATDLDPQMGQAYIERGKVYILKRQYELAVADFTKSIEMDPQNARLYWFRGVAYGGGGQNQLAIDEYNKALRIDPNMYMVYWSSALAYEELRSDYLAMQSYNQFLQYAPPQDPNVENAKKRLANLKILDKDKIETTNKSFDAVKNATTIKYIFDFLKSDYLTVNVDKPRWKIGFSQNTDSSAIVELVLSNETVENWTELITVKFIREQRNITPQQYGAFIEKNIRSSYGDKAQVKILRTSDSDVILEYRVAGQPGVQDEHTIMRIFKGTTSFGFVNYAVKPSMSQEKRAIGLNIIGNVKYSDYLPQE